MNSSNLFVFISLDKKTNSEISMEKKITEKNNSKIFSDEIDEWDKKNPFLSFNVGNTTEIYKSAGIANNRKISIDSKKLKKIMRDHLEMKIGYIKKIPYAIFKPIAILKSVTKPGRIIIMSDVFPRSIKNKCIPLIVVLELNPVNRKGEKIDEIKVVSVYGKDNITQNWLNKSNYLYITKNKKKIRRWEASTGLQLPVGLLTSSIDNVNRN